MATAQQNSRHTSALAVFAPALLLGCVCMLQAQTPAPAAAATKAQSPERVPLDSIVAVVNNDLILESDVDAEQRFAAFTPLRPDATETRAKLVERLIDRTLIQQQMQIQPPAPVTDQELDAELATLRKNIPACASYHCDTDAGWEKFCADHGFTVQEVRDRWRARMEVLRFIEQRFRMGIRITPAEVDAYYKNKLLPAYQKDNVPPPSEDKISDRIQEILLQQQVTGLLDDWLKALRAQGSVRILDPTVTADTGAGSGGAPQ